MKPDVLVAYPLRPRQMAMLEETYTVHRLDLLEGAAREATLPWWSTAMSRLTTRSSQNCPG